MKLTFLFLVGAMAARSQVKDLQEAVICSICLASFNDSVILIKCGHNFCRSCITQYCKEFKTSPPYPCPQCREPFREGEFQPNRELRNVVEIAKKIPEPRGKKACEKHEELLKLFCEVDQTLICLVCRESHSHKDHSLLPVKEAALDYKEQIQRHLESLKKERDEILSYKSSGENTSQELLKQLKTERQKIVLEFQELHQFLEEQERLLLAHLEELNKEIEKRRAEYVAKLSEELSSFSSLISEMEQKCQLPASEFLQDIKGTLSREEETEAGPDKSPDLPEAVLQRAVTSCSSRPLRAEQGGIGLICHKGDLHQCDGFPGCSLDCGTAEPSRSPAWAASRPAMLMSSYKPDRPCADTDTYGQGPARPCYMAHPPAIDEPAIEGASQFPTAPALPPRTAPTPTAPGSLDSAGSFSRLPSPSAGGTHTGLVS
ncbi:E3 ubiquitin-protein ligase TRIM41-like isoform X3 [Mauremys mutica]|uniref:E3 ubiquitin-protein ligase TRIM41-like isoform X3 n=1 Tax=Mauremys mutica TaxID=74926 RepID=UPI001D168BCD|nr:E3 ubiquitin-protein ligase TRIM41-like isoform X3 [Mauremys mutica]